MLLDEARRLGAVIKLDSEVRDVDFDQPSVILASQERIHADVIIGADGMFSVPLAVVHPMRPDRCLRPKICRSQQGPGL